MGTSPSAASARQMPDDSRNRMLRGASFVGTRVADSERGPQVRLNPDDARARLLVDGELAWVQGPRRQELATVVIDLTMKRGDIGLRDVAGGPPPPPAPPPAARPRLARPPPRSCSRPSAAP